MVAARKYEKCPSGNSPEGLSFYLALLNNPLSSHNTIAIPADPGQLAAGKPNTGTSKLQATNTKVVVIINPRTNNPKTAKQPNPKTRPVSLLLIF